MAVYGWRFYREVMEGQERQREKWLRRAALRKERRARAVEAIKVIKEPEALIWRDVADLLNRRGVCNHLGRSWNEVTAASFVKKEEELTGNRLLPWLWVASKHESGVRRGMVRRLSRNALAAEVRRVCAEARTFGEAARLLNRERLKTLRGGKWTEERVSKFEKRYREVSGVLLVGRLKRKGRWARQ